MQLAGFGRGISLTLVSFILVVHLPAAAEQRILVVDPGTPGAYSQIADALAAVPSGGATVVVRPGTYQGGFCVPANTLLIGDGVRSVKILAPSGGAQHGITVTNEDVVLENLEIDGARPVQSDLPNTGGIGIVISAARVTVRDCYIHNTWGHGIQVNGDAADVNVRHNRIENTATSTVEKQPATNEPMAAIASAGPARPWRAIW